MANYRPRSGGRQFIPAPINLNGSRESVQRQVKYEAAPNPNRPLNPSLPNGPSASAMRPHQYDVVSGPAPMKTTNAFHASGPTASTPKIGLGLGF